MTHLRLRRPAGLMVWLWVALAWGVLCAQEVRINELMTSNGATLRDENGDSPDWFELYNPGPQTAQLDRWGVTDDAGRPFKWVFRHATLEPGQFLLVFASGKDRQPADRVAAAPASLPGLRLWLRADAVNTNDPVQVRRVGSSVFIRRWTDQSGYGNHASQGSESSQPVWVAGGLNGQPALRFDGSDDGLLLSRTLGTNSFCLLAVFRTSRSHEIDSEGPGGVGGTSGQRYLFGAQHGGDYGAGAGLSVGTNGIAVYEHGAGYMPALASYVGYPGPGGVLVAVNYEAKQVSLDVLGTVIRAGIASPRSWVTAPIEIGRGAYGAFGGDLAEVLLYDRSLSEDERKGLAQWLASKYSVDLPQFWHTSFELSAAGEELVLTRPDGTVADAVRFGPLARDVSYGRQPDGLGPFLLFAEPTPGKANTTPGAAELLGTPQFSQSGGFYTEALVLELSVTNRDALIHYTLDGSEPTLNSPRYEQPLRLGSRAGTRNTISMIPTVPGGALPLGEVFKGWALRARAFKSNALPSAVATATFWIDPRGRARYSLPVVSLVTAPANFFDNTLGIYVPGVAPNGNYSQRGPEWERPGHVELYETNGLCALSQEAGVKIHGNTSQGFPIKGLDLDGTSGLGRQPFRYRLFPDRARIEFEHVLLRPTGHDQSMAFMRDELMQSLAEETGAEAQAARACIVFVNGEYWGLHYLKEKEDAAFVASFAERPEDEIDYLEGYASAKAGDTTQYQALIEFMKGHDLSVPSAYATVAELMDVANYADYKICEIFFYRWDIGNHRLWRPRTPDGRWRWLQFDNDVGWGGFWAEQPAWQFNMLAADLTPSGSLHGHNNEVTTFLLRKLMESPEFRRDFINRFQDLLNSLFLPDHTRARIDRLASVLAPEMAEHTRRWRSPVSLAEWQNNVNYLRTYASNRPQFARAHLRQQFGLQAPCSLALSVAPEQGGSIRLNSLTIRSTTATPWSGLYFKGHPIRLEAQPAPGFRFEAWDGLGDFKTNVLILSLNGDFALTARFSAAAPDQPRLIVERTGPDTLTLQGTGRPGAECRLEMSSDLTDWTSDWTVTLDQNGTARWTEEWTPATPRRFYRLRLP